MYPVCLCDFLQGSEDVSRRGSVVCGFEFFLNVACFCDEPCFGVDFCSFMVVDPRFGFYLYVDDLANESGPVPFLTPLLTDI